MCPVKAGMGVSSAAHITAVAWSAQSFQTERSGLTILPQAVQTMVDMVQVESSVIAVMLGYYSFTDEFLYKCQLNMNLPAKAYTDHTM